MNPNNADAFNIRFNSGDLEVVVGNSLLTWALDSISQQDDMWHHYGLVRSATGITLYVDGVSKGLQQLGVSSLYIEVLQVGLDHQNDAEISVNGEVVLGSS